MKILLAEDDQEIASFLIRSFKFDEKIDVDHVADGKEALKRLRANQYDAMILDLLLPSMNGETILKTIRKEKDATPVIVLTALQDTETKIRLLNAGADDYLVKPFSFVELVARIKSIIQRSAKKETTSETLTVGELVMIPKRRLVMRANKKIKLRLKEYALLEYLMRHPDQVVSRITLIEKVWDYNARIFSNTVDSHVSLLRKKINRGFRHKMIETIHGVGYLLNGE